MTSIEENGKNMEKEIKENIEESKYYMLLLFMLFTEDLKEKNAQWESFADELRYKNRFTVKHTIIDEIHECKAKAVTVHSKNTVLYRARIFNKINFDRYIKYYLQECGYCQSDITKKLKECTPEQKLMPIVSDMLSDSDDGATSRLAKAQNKWRRKIKFKGWNKKESGAPPADLVGNGRANPDHIRYLYLSEDPVTPVYEVRPVIGDVVSVAKFKLHKDVRLYDLTLDNLVEESGETSILSRLYNTIGVMFSRPNNGDTSKYLPTQYIAEEIKNMGFDGLRYRSSLNKGGYNVVLFNPSDCEAVSSELIEVKGIELKLDDPFIYKIGTSEFNSQ